MVDQQACGAASQVLGLAPRDVDARIDRQPPAAELDRASDPGQRLALFPPSHPLLQAGPVGRPVEQKRGLLGRGHAARGRQSGGHRLESWIRWRHPQECGPALDGR